MTKPVMVFIDHAKIGTIVSYGGFAAFEAIVGRGDVFLYVQQAKDEIDDGLSKEGQKKFIDWLNKNKRRVIKAPHVRGEKERNHFDPDHKRGTEGNNKAWWDMGARKAMFEHKDKYDFEVISADKTFLRNKFKKTTSIVDLQFKRVSLKSIMTWYLTHPEATYTRKQFENIKGTIERKGFGESSKYETEYFELPETFERSKQLRKAGQNRKVARGINTLVRNGAPKVMIALAAVPTYFAISKHAEAQELSFGEAALELGLNFSEEDLKQMAAEAGVDLAVSFTPVGAVKKAWDVLGNVDDILTLTKLYADAFPENETLQEMAAVARSVETSEEFQIYLDGRDALVGAAGSVGDAAGAVVDLFKDEHLEEERIGKWLWDGSAQKWYDSDSEFSTPYNEEPHIIWATDKETAALDKERSRRAAYNAFMDFRAANKPDPNVIEGWSFDEEKQSWSLRIGWRPGPILHASEEQSAVLNAERARRLHVNAALENIQYDPAQPVSEGENIYLLRAQELIEGKEESAAQEASPESIPANADEIKQAANEVTSNDRIGQAFEAVGQSAGRSEASGVPDAPDPFARKTSYDRYQYLGRTSDEEEQALAEYDALLEESYLDMGGDQQLAEMLATDRFKRSWGLSAFADVKEGTVLKHAVETAYPDFNNSKHSYVRDEAEALLQRQGIVAKRWFVSPNAKTSLDFAKGEMDEDGYGPRMQLSYEDDMGSRHILTENFQAHILGAAGRDRDRRTQERHQRMIELGLIKPEKDENKIALQAGARQAVPNPASNPAPVPKAKSGLKPQPKPLDPQQTPIPTEKPKGEQKLAEMR